MKIDFKKHYIKNYFINDSVSKKYQILCKEIYPKLEPDPYSDEKIRFRSYQRFILSVKDNNLRIDKENSYQQTYDANDLDGGKVRIFPDIPKELINSNFIYEVLNKDIKIIKENFPHLLDQNEIHIGVHPIRYKATSETPSYSSPIWLHKDDEPLVFLHFISKSENIIGGESILARNGRSIDKVLSLDKFMETIILTRNFFHAVTPIGSKNHNDSSYRDILLVTIEKMESLK